ncbi:MAG: alpha/beta hydrolase [Chloroflexota bacterium]
MLTLVVLTSFLSTSAAQAAGQPKYPPVLTVPVKRGTVVKDLTYCTNQVPLRLDLYYPTSGNAPWPAVLYVHGGGWVGGDKSTTHIADEVEALRAAGYIVTSVDYRLAPRYAFPAQIVDLKCSVRFLRAHAAELQLDPEHIGAWGTSAGGHLVSLLGLADESAGWDVGEYKEQSSEVQAVVDMFGPTDLMHAMDEADGVKRMLILFGGVKPTWNMLASASPVTHVSPGDAPFLIIHGEEDAVITPQQSIRLYQRLTSSAVPANLILVAHAGHGLAAVGGDPKPSHAEIIQSMIAFFDRYLKAKP